MVCIASTVGLLVLVGSGLISAPLLAQGGQGSDPQVVPHPPVIFLDSAGQPVRSSGAPISTMKTCAACHDTEFISSHSYHAWLGANETKFKKARPFDSGPGPLERFDPLIYERFDRNAGATFDLGLADWLRRYGYLHIGGGFATQKADGTPLTDLKPGQVPDPWTYSMENGQRRPWDFKKSGVAEMNCFLCHIDGPANQARIKELAAGRFGSAATATLTGTGLVQRDGDHWKWNVDRMDEQGAVADADLGLRRPKNSNCGLCHGFADTGRDRPFFVAPDLHNRRTETTGQIVSPHRIRRSGMNIVGKDKLSRAWDVHAERLLQCVDCHGSINNPATYAESSGTRPQHLSREARRLTYAEYLRTPSHDFAKGHSSQGVIANDLDGTMRDCRDCHDSEDTHDWLPYVERHMQGLQCEACHVPRIFAPARMQSDWTMLDRLGQAQVTYRGYAGDPEHPDIASPATLVEGFVPALLPRKDEDGMTRLAPQNIATTWYWLDESTGKPVPLEILKRAFFVDPQHPEKGYRPELLAALDRDGDGHLLDDELHLVEKKRVVAVAAVLVGAGAKVPVIQGDIQPYGLHHDVAPGTWATRDCADCHGEDSRFSGALVLGNYVPGQVLPKLVGDAPVSLAGDIRIGEGGRLLYEARPAEVGIGLLGFEPSRYVDEIGAWVVLLVILGVLVHGGIRIFLHQMARVARERQATEAKREVETIA